MGRTNLFLLSLNKLLIHARSYGTGPDNTEINMNVPRDQAAASARKSPGAARNSTDNKSREMCPREQKAKCFPG